MKKIFYTLAATSILFIIWQFSSSVLRSTGYRPYDEYSTHLNTARDNHKLTATSRHKESVRYFTLNKESNITDVTDVSSKNIFGVRKRGKKYLLVYNNVPKCGSRSLARSIKDILQKNGNFRGIKVKGDKRNGKDLNRSFRGIKTPAYISGHKPFFVPLRSDVIFVNMVRDPVDRFISLYYFALNGDKSGVKPDNRQRQNQTIDEYIKGGGNVTSNIFFHFNSEDLNDSNTENTRILERAKANIDRYFILVGLTEELDVTVALLGKMLPDLLHGIDRVYKNLVSERRQGYSTMNKVPPSNETVSILKEKLSAEYDLYFFVKQRFHEQKRKYGIK